ncbi:hypothetical protein F4859DRAFT_517509 [Xylaria cf. heliscus]|nr:hypothetical protein F4859DRAFT_517509 [Xylaria cf. heliscus]
MNRQSPYQILGVNRTDDMPTIKRAYHSLCLRLHPDKAGQTPDAHERFVRVQNAYEYICKTHEKHNYSHDEPDRDYSAGKEGAWYQSGSEHKYEAKGKANHAEFMIHEKATDAVYQLSFDINHLMNRLDGFFIRYSMVCPRAEKSTWSVLDRCSQSLKATAKDVNTLMSQISTAKESWKQDDQTRVLLATMSRLRVRFDKMDDVYRQLESTALAVEEAPVKSRQVPKRLLRTQALRWP